MAFVGCSILQDQILETFVGCSIVRDQILEAFENVKASVIRSSALLLHVSDNDEI